MQIGSVLWQPSKEAINKLKMSQFASNAAKRSGLQFNSYDELHHWSVNDLAGFWSEVWDFCDVKGKKGEPICGSQMTMPGAEFFPDAKINFAENLLRKKDDSDAIVFRCEDKFSSRLTWRDLYNEVSRFRQVLTANGVGQGDRVAAMLPNMPEAVIGMLATSSLGAIWSSCSPDFGEGGVLDRFGQIEPRVFIACDGYWYNGKKISIAKKLAAISKRLPNLQRTIIVDFLQNAAAVAKDIENSVTWKSACDQFSASEIEFEHFPFDHPLYILFSSGTTGIPKCIIHSQGGVLLQHLKEQQLHCNLHEGDKFFYFTTCGWMMWNWLVTGLASGATLILYDGSPFAPDGNVLFDYADEEGFAFFGTSAKFIDAVRNAGLKPRQSHNLSTINTITSTGSPLAPENFRFVYDSIKKDVHLASISGGTDIAACFVGGIPAKEVRVGEIQGPMLGMAVEVWDDDGAVISKGKGELVCTKPFPSMPLGFWADPDDKKYHDAYFDRFEGVWCHGDFAEWTENAGLIIHGRSDATLNPQGVRIGTAEIYNQVEQLTQVEEAICIGQEWKGDVRVILFVRLADNLSLNEDLITLIKDKIRTGASPRHVPAKVIAVNDIPRTKSGKITELAVREIVHGRVVKNQEALANPEALQLYVDLPELNT